MSFGGIPFGGAPFGATLDSDGLPDLSWQPVLPVHPAWRTKGASQTVRTSVVTTISPIPNPAPPVDLTWQPTFPSHPQQYRARRFQPIAMPQLIDAQRVGVSWLPVLRTTPARRRVRASVPPIQDVLGPLIVPRLTAWQTVSRGGPTRRRAQRFQSSADVIAPLTILNAVHCIEWTQEALTPPQLLSETLTQSQLLSEALTSPLLQSEDLC